ncbi:pyridoxal 5'-phosphate synthase glutaminase subunit PdxT [Saccharococcus caldoxylosilyticus]|uniref:pyridoxal 5'-phosphate synthase glutaminase subunit PdxT n=1 Tax=Saccharococcus caldoxylosilyticus TaxID=81408 RepID=UPI001FCA706D|nr:pyridoxal 5'-phosphate synthase glutaminase subunit PdxT [Parageobacillus caldoxylosilyticus]BDG34106.1 pyridoxal 5'-phosphate synthase subunit PdxT [Parageobacillus caldoxylosilyticus]BDG37873.1 pyridoxal 5'-phosphate synthase subunit PdxT [Parageobacillus caldoxylosilyticus]
MKIGVLGLQGAVQEHVCSIEACGAEAVVVKKPDQLAELDGLILPGGESTTMRRLMDKYGFMEPLKQFAALGKPMFGTCAGLILLAKRIVGYDEPHLGLMDITVERNSFGRQRESFEAELSIAGIADDFIGVFIRAPHIVEVGEDVEILAKYEDRIVAARQGQFLGCSFHPELTDDHRMTQYFLNMVKEAKHKTGCV